MQVKYKFLSEAAKLPCYAHEGDAGADLFAAADRIIQPREWVAVPIGLSIQVPIGFEAQIRSRSGLAYWEGVAVLNAPGTIDSGYTGEIKVILINHGSEPFTVKVGDRIAQMVVAPIVRAVFAETHEQSESDRGDGGFGSTGIA